MRTVYDVGGLDAADVHRAYAVIQHVMPGLDLEAWKTLTATVDARHDWLTVMDAHGYIRGLCYVFTREHPVRGSQMEVPIFASVSLVDKRGVARELFELAKSRARQAGVETIHFWSAGSANWESLMKLREAAPWDDGVMYDLRTDRTFLC
ncbi:hypothetical protein [Neorhizobium alkalisoli]|uniref:hypothetical protein n=1 Tax=Neorhizobium alkalisoli TaxID=528178 RepID=UPI00131A3B7B|nr:hypothetical protein [Neorhizobium alkalisoli]